MRTTPDMITLENRMKYRQLDSAQLTVVKNAVYTVLEETGVYFPLEEALDIFQDHGAQVDRDTQIVKIPASLVEKALATAPSQFTLAARDPQFDVHMDGSRTHIIPSSCGVFFMDLETGEKRSSTKADVAQLTRVFDALPYYNITRPIVAAEDKGMTSALHECHALLTNSVKHARGGTSMHPKLVPFIKELGVAVAGSEQALEERPLINANICAMSPLCMDTHSLECALTYAKSGIPVTCMTMTTMATTAPADPLSALVTGECEVVALMTLIQLAVPGARLIHSNLTSHMDPVNSTAILDMALPVGHMAVQMAREIWKVPCLGGMLTSMNAPSPGWESAMVDGQGAVFMGMAGPDIGGFLGLMEDGLTVYPEQIVLVHEAVQRAHEMMGGFEFREEDLALDVIHKVGPRNHFLLEPHTAKGLRALRHSPVLRKKGQDKQFRDPRDVAREMYKEIAETHQPDPLAPDVLREMDRILAAADALALKLN